MNKQFIKNISIFGLILSAASIITAAILPADKANNQVDNPIAGSLTQHSSINNGGNPSSFTCAPYDGSGEFQNCNASTAEGSETTFLGEGSTSYSPEDCEGSTAECNTTH